MSVYAHSIHKLPQETKRAVVNIISYLCEQYFYFYHQTFKQKNHLSPYNLMASLPSIMDDGIKDESRVELEQRELWQKFHPLVNEMIITKTGRRMFPALEVKLSGLEKTANYYVIMDIVPCDGSRWKFHDSRWAVAGEAYPEMQNPALHIHPDSPASGEHWMEKGASFHRVKVTNNATLRTDEFTVLNSMHKYQPRIHVVRTNDINSLLLKVGNWTTCIFPETEFMAVTAYQNSQITDLKIDNNPWAKGFRDGGESKRQNKGQLSHLGLSSQNGQNEGPDEKMNNKMEEAAKQPTYDNEIQLYINSLLEKGQQQQEPMKKQTEWSMDLTSICGDGNDQNALKGQKREIGQMLNDKNSSVGKLTGFEQLREISLNLVLLYFIIFVCIAIIGLLVFPSV